ncbi:MAG: PilZ domain-containing protein [Bdellovibrionota bacterium]
MQENKIKITNQDRIIRILSKTCQANLQVYLRVQENVGLAVKAKASNIISAKAKSGSKFLTLKLSGISDQGIEYLQGRSFLQAEFVMMATKITFICKLLRLEEGTVLVTFPKSLISIERRKNARFATNEQVSAFINVGKNPAKDLATTPPVFLQYESLKGYMAVADISLGGFCMQTRFPYFYETLKRGNVEDSSSLILPMQPVIPIRYEIRWSKKITEHKNVEQDNLSITSYKFGCEFVQVSEDVLMNLRQFFNRILQSKAI